MGNEKERKQKRAKLNIPQQRVFSEAFKQEKVVGIVWCQVLDHYHH